jgi:palmitoyltransferase
MFSAEDEIFSAVQQGAFEVVQDIVASKLVSSSAVDRDGCSLLHWAAINNRCVIAAFLMDGGASPSVSGGILGETPLQWALRRGFYSMVRLLASRGSNLSHKSAQGLDALHMAVQMGDINMIFLLLHFGADPNSVDSNGDTPMLWLLRHETGRRLMYPLQILIGFGGDVSLRNPTSLNNGLHLVAKAPEITRRTAFLVHQAGYKSGIVLAKNRDNLTPYKVA